MSEVADELINAMVDLYWTEYESRYEAANPVRGTDEDSEDVFEALHELVAVPRLGPLILKALSAAAQTSQRKAFLGAGPGERLLVRASTQELRALENLMEQDQSLRDALKHAYVDDQVNAVASAWLNLLRREI